MRITITAGRAVRTIDTTVMDYGSGIVLADDYLDVTGVEKSGLVLERCMHTATDEGLLTVTPEAIELVTPGELASADTVEADGLPLLERRGGAMVPALADSLYDEDGGIIDACGSGMRIYYTSGSYEVISPTMLLYSDGHLAQDDLVDFERFDTEGISWERGTWTKDDDGLMSLKPDASVVVLPEQMDRIEAVSYEGRWALVRTAEGLECVLGLPEENAGPESAEESQQGNGSEGFPEENAHEV